MSQIPENKKSQKCNDCDYSLSNLDTFQSCHFCVLCPAPACKKSRRKKRTRSFVFDQELEQKLVVAVPFMAASLPRSPQVPNSTLVALLMCA